VTADSCAEILQTLQPSVSLSVVCVEGEMLSDLLAGRLG